MYPDPVALVSCAWPRLVAPTCRVCVHWRREIGTSLNADANASRYQTLSTRIQTHRAQSLGRSSLGCVQSLGTLDVEARLWRYHADAREIGTRPESGAFDAGKV